MRGKGRGWILAGFEIMVMTPAIENHIRKNETFKIPSAIQTGKRLPYTSLEIMSIPTPFGGRSAASSGPRWASSVSNKM